MDSNHHLHTCSSCIILIVLIVSLSAHHVTMATTFSRKLKRLRSTEVFDIAVLRCVSSNCANLEARGKTEQKGEGLLAMFLNAPAFYRNLPMDPS